MKNRIFSSVADAGVTRRVAFIEGELALALTGQEEGCGGVLVCMDGHDVSDVREQVGNARPRFALRRLTGKYTSFAAAIVDIALIDGLTHALRTGVRIPDLLAFREGSADDVLIICGPHESLKLRNLVARPLHADERVLIAGGRHARTIVANLTEPGTRVHTGTSVKHHYDRYISEIRAELPKDATLPIAAE